jgi:cytochrome d ubiquinol oxidase subunit II
VLVAVELYPNMLLSTIDSKYNIDIYNAASSQKSLKIMLTMVIIGAPLVLSYTIFVYNTFRGKVKLDEHSY